MGEMALPEMRESLRWDLFNRGDLTTTQLDRWLNWSYRHVSQPRVFRHRELQVDTGNTVALALDQVAYSVTAATLGMTIPFIYDVTYVAGTDASVLTTRRRDLRGGQDIRQFDTGFLAGGEPTHYALYGTDLFINTRPAVHQVGHIVKIRGWMQPALLTEDAPITVLRASFDEVLLLGARWRGFRSIGRVEMAEIAKADFVGLLSDMQEPWSSDAEDWGGYFQPETRNYERT